jgi:hypothetical protein
VENQIFNVSEDYPASFNKQVFYGLKSFAARLKYCSDHLPKIAAGSGRVVFKIDEQTVLKLAKNPKGIAQNLQEAQIGRDSYFSSIVAQVINYDQDDKWIESELAKKVTPTRFKQLVGVDINTAGSYLRMREDENKPKRGGYGYSHGLAPELIEQLHENEFLVGVVDLMFNFNIMAADFTRLSSYGEVNREGHPTIVLVDYGLSDEVWQDHYERKPQPSPNYQRW